MLLPMFGFLFSLLVIGGLASLVAISDPMNARVARYLGFTAFFASLGAMVLSVSLALFGGQVLHSQTLAGFGFFVGSAGGLGGACFGLYRAFN